MADIQPKKSVGRNPLLYPEPVLLVGTYDAEGKPNVMTAAWGGICSSGPLSLMVAIQPIRWTHAAILARKAFTISIPTVGMAREADYVGIVSGRREDKFAVAGWTPVRAEHVDAPYVGECPVVLECRLSQTVDLDMHTMMIGEIVDVKADADCLDPLGGMPDPARFSPLIFDSGTKRYYGLGAHVADAFTVGKALLTSHTAKQG